MSAMLATGTKPSGTVLIAGIEIAASLRSSQ